MRLLKTAFHPDVSPDDISPASGLALIERHAARGIVVKGESILLLYTQRYHDYSLPGGGIDLYDLNGDGLADNSKLLSSHAGKMYRTYWREPENDPL